MIPFLLISPLLIAIVAIALVPYKNAKYLALLASLVSLAMLYFISYGGYTITWFSVGSASISITSFIAPVNMLLLAIVLVVAPIIFFYSFGYMDLPTQQKRFYIEMLAFEAAMLVFAMSGDLITLFIAWEFLSLMSYLLIGFYNKKEKASRAARKAMTTVLIGDIAILAAIVILWNAFGSFTFSTIFASIDTNMPALYAAAILLMIAILTKSAQFPFQEWLPDAMEGPTPVSAFLHSSTMVKAGVFALVILYPIFAATHTLSIFFVIGIITVILSTLNAMKETQIKRVIAYSTVQELGLMIIAASSGAIAACLYFFLVQSFYKALLFFSSGAAMKVSGKEDLIEMSGLKDNKLVYITTLFGILSIAGFIPFSGFFANLGIGSSVISNIYVYILISLVGLSTSFFIFRWLFLVSKNSRNQRISMLYAGLPKSMVSTMLLLAILALIGSAAFFYLPGFLTSQSTYLTSLIKPIGISFYQILIETALAILGVLVSYLVYVHGKKLNEPLSAIVYNSRVVNAIYLYFTKLVYLLSEGIAIFDVYLSDFFDDIGKSILLSGRALRRFSVGSINLYVLIFSLGLILLFAYVYFSGAL